MEKTNDTIDRTDIGESWIKVRKPFTVSKRSPLGLEPRPVQLYFSEFSDLLQLECVQTLAAIDEAYTVSKGVADDFENASCVFSDYGKDFMKKARVSPDAYIQMALQMAYFKDQQKFELTYEPAVMRLFREGRTETVRSCSNESSAFVRAMLDKEQTNEKRLSLLKAACDRHQDYYRNAMAGRGVDRHLFAMYVISRYYEIKSPFWDNVFSMTYALSTSQTPQHQMVEYAKVLNKERDLFWPAGGFTCPDGSKYGVCYTIATTGDILSFHVATKKQFNETMCSSRLFLLFPCAKSSSLALPHSSSFT